MWKDFFYFTKRERQGIIVLVVLILGVCLASQVLPHHPTEEEDTEAKEAFTKEYDDFIASLQEIEKDKAESSRSPSAEREIILSPFDPNSADSITFLTLGLPPWIAKNILRYRSKQGTFRHPEDFRKIYGLTEEQYQTLRPYIRIAESNNKKDTVQLLTESKVPADYPIKYQPGTKVDLNKADTTELKKIPGIGSSIARMIVNYRKQLGGFARIEQLQEIHLKTDKLRSWFLTDVSQISHINLNKASMERMTHHPYINFYQAKVIIEYRKKKGRINSLKQLSLYEEFSPADLERLQFYICFDE